MKFGNLPDLAIFPAGALLNGRDLSACPATHPAEGIDNDYYFHLIKFRPKMASPQLIITAAINRPCHCSRSFSKPMESSVARTMPELVKATT
jgi:hypothetical protein